MCKQGFQYIKLDIKIKDNEVFLIVVHLMNKMERKYSIQQ